MDSEGSYTQEVICMQVEPLQGINSHRSKLFNVSVYARSIGFDLCIDISTGFKSKIFPGP